MSRNGIITHQAVRGRFRFQMESAKMIRLALLPVICVGVLHIGTMGAAAAGGRILTPLDVVSIRIVNQPELDTTTRLEPDGTINFPYVGRIKAAGLTEDELARALERRLVELKIISGF